jgi:hypothetical protein
LRKLSFVFLKKEMKRKKLVFVLTALIVLSLVLWLTYSYFQFKKEMKGYGEWRDVKLADYESVDNYVITQTPEGEMVVNENMGLSFMVPEGWLVEKLAEENELEISTTDLDVKGLGSDTSFPRKGCLIRLGISIFDNDSSEETLPYIITEKIKEEALEDIQKVVFIGDNHPSLETLRFKDSEVGRIILIETPIDNKIYHFGISFSLNEQERCRNDFYDFLKTISIK